MPNIENYVPVLRFKQAEREALTKTAPTIRERITPLFEFIMPNPKRDKDDYKIVLADSKTMLLSRLPKFIKDINKCCFQGSAFVDVHLIDGELRAETLKTILDGSSETNVTLIPVTHIIPVVSTDADNDTRRVAIEYALSSGHGLCIRIDRFNLDDADLSDVISQFVSSNKLPVDNTDLLIDLGIIGPDDKADAIAAQLARLPYLSQWRSFIVAGGAFPKDLTAIEKHTQEQITRYDWQLWSALGAEPSLMRKPIYSDYTIQHPLYFGHMDGPVNTSASIRYTSDTIWEISRGEWLGNPKGSGYKQYPALAKLLIEQAFYKGTDYSFGDSYIADRAKPDNKNTGNPTTWLKAGINHHLTLVVKTLASRTSGKESS
jgi:hypothetical protein